MPQKLSSKIRSHLLRDDPAKLMAALPSSSGPFSEMFLDGSPILFRAAQSGAARCFQALLQADPDPKSSLLWRDSFGESCFSFLAPSASPETIAAAVGLAGLEPLSWTDANGWTPWSRALEHARWGSALAMLQADPSLALGSDPHGRQAFRAVSEPSYLFREGSLKGQAWSAPPPELIKALSSAGADPWAADPSGRLPLHSALLSGNRALSEPLLAALEAGLRSELPAEAARFAAILSSSSGGYSLAAAAAASGDSSALSRLLAMGAPAESFGFKERSPLREAFSRGDFVCCDLLSAAGASVSFEPERFDFPLSALAIRSRDPLASLAWLQSHGADLRRERDSRDSSFAERAWEELPFGLALSVWRLAPPEARLKAPRSPFGALERAARSKADAKLKCEFLLSEGLLPAKADLSLPYRSHQSVFFRSPGEGNREFHLNELWRCPPDPKSSVFSSPDASASSLAEDSFDPFSLSLDLGDSSSGAIIPRPSLLGYSLAYGSRESFFFWLGDDKAPSLFGEADFRLALSFGIRSDASAERLLALSERAKSLGFALDDLPIRAHAFRSLGLAKARSLGLRPASIPQRLSELADDGRLGEAFDASRGFLDPDSSEQAPWVLSRKSATLKALSALLPIDGLWSAIGAALCSESLAAARPEDPALIRSLLVSLPERARLCDPQSPWGSDPDAAASLWDAQIGWELQQAAGHSKKPSNGLSSRTPILDEGIGAALGNVFLHAGEPRSLAKLLPAGLPPPKGPASEFWSRFGEAQGQALGFHSRRGASAGPDGLRSLCSAMLASDSWAAAIRALPGEVSLGNAPDPFVLSEFLEAGASRLAAAPGHSSRGGPAGVSPSVFPGIARRWAGKLSPASAERLAELSAEHSPDWGGLDVAFELAHGGGFRGDPVSKTAIARAVRAARRAPPSAWLAADRAGLCPILAAIERDQASLAVALAALAPEGYRIERSSRWLTRWMRSAARSGFRDLFSDQALSFGFGLPSGLSSGGSSAHPDFVSLPDFSPLTLAVAQNISQISQRRSAELAAMLSLGGRLGDGGALEDSLCARSMFAGSTPHDFIPALRCLRWAILEGLSPSATVRAKDSAPADQWWGGSSPLDGVRSGSALLGVLEPLSDLSRKAPAMLDAIVSEFAEICAFWRDCGFPLEIECDPAHPRWSGAPAPASLIEILPPEARSAVESRLLQGSSALPGRQAPRRSRAL